MKKTEKLLNICFGLSLIYWGVAGLISNYEDGYIPFVRLFITILNITVGILIILREPVSREGSFSSILVSLPSLICGGLLFKLSKPLILWDTTTEILFIIGGLFTFVSFLFLGRSFSIFPGIRAIVSNGLFRFIRHPSYLGETIMVTSCLIAAEDITSLIPFIIFIPGILYRIKEEERLLMTNVNYQTYKENVKWRLVPYIW